MNQEILILDQENIPDGISRVNEGCVKIPIRNNTLNPLQVKNNLEKYKSIFEIREKEETALQHSENIHQRTLQILQSSKLNHLEPQQREIIEKLIAQY